MDRAARSVAAREVTEEHLVALRDVVERRQRWVALAGSSQHAAFAFPLFSGVETLSFHNVYSIAH